MRQGEPELARARSRVFRPFRLPSLLRARSHGREVYYPEDSAESGSDPADIGTWPDGNLWFTEATAKKIGQINSMTQVISGFPVSTGGALPSHITTWI